MKPKKPPAIKFTSFKGCGKPLVTFEPHSVVYWNRGPYTQHPVTKKYGRYGEKKLAVYQALEKAPRLCGTYSSNWGTRLYLCEECLVRNGLKW